MPPARPQPPLIRPQGALVWLLAILVFVLGMLAACPTAHAHLHDESEAHENRGTFVHDDAGCAVTLFQHGITAPLAPPRLDAPRVTWIATLPRTHESKPFSVASHLLKPTRGPPR